MASIDGETVGFLRVQPPDAATWIAPMVGLAPAGYVAVMSVTARQRGGGAGSALMAAAHAEFDGVAVSVLHYAALSPLSGPFWHRYLIGPPLELFVLLVLVSWRPGRRPGRRRCG